MQSTSTEMSENCDTFEHQSSTSQVETTLVSMAMALMNHWQLSTQDQADLLGLGACDHDALDPYRKGELMGMGASNGRDSIPRVKHLLGIHQSLRLMFPHNLELAYRWMGSANKAFGNRTPVATIKEQGLSGLVKVSSYLSRVQGEAIERLTLSNKE